GRVRQRPVRGERDRRPAHPRGGRDALGRHHGAPHLAGAAGRGGALAAQARLSLLAAIATSRSVMPPSLWLTQRSVTVSHEIAISGWWSASAAAFATLLVNAIEPSKSPQEYAFSSAPARTSQPCMPATCARSSDSASTAMP